jgi:lysozyme
LTAQLRYDEGVKEYAYTDSEGYLTIGVGRLIDRTKGGKLSEDEIDYLLDNDIDKVQNQAIRASIKAFERHDFEDAARELLDSRWATQVGNRALRIAEAVRAGEW